MNDRFLLSQLLGVIGTALYALSYQCRDNRRLFTVQVFSYVFYTAHLFMLGATTGGVSYLLNLARSVFLAGSWAFGRSKKMCAILCALQVIVAATTWAGWISLLPVCGNIASTIGGYTHDARKIRLATMLVNSPLWIVYDALVGSWAGILDEVFSEVSALISICRYGWNDLGKEAGQ